MRKFEYMVLDVPAGGFWGGKVNFDELTHKLNELGNLGWEVTTTTDTNTFDGASRGVLIILKREIR
ncbi:DUF4177 domain-containing protein [Fibrisoma montanum]|uniref:DUF4177 domain-containing protein n=1 Tax=Fibrisoma montanum TaxID=2305895 RepID=A0A418M8D6_9BACT|nr:DUF4177 domain-containing protein [Fibrisoma montanum]RIV22356.1 DUF4177 domain-containing protein [Fibrisoma montanum]